MYSSRNDKNIQSQEKKPFTVMLDIYPMEKQEPATTKQPRPAIFVPIRPGQEYFRPNTHVFKGQLKRKKKNGRMLMKLNLYPRGKKKHSQRRTWGILGAKQENDDDDSDYSEEPEEMSGCKGIIGHNPYGKPITTSWREPNGETVHAKFVSLQQWDDRMGA